MGILGSILKVFRGLLGSLRVFEVFGSLGVFGGLWGFWWVFGGYGDLLKLDLLKIRLFGFSCKMRLSPFLMQETFGFLMQDETFRFSHGE